MSFLVLTCICPYSCPGLSGWALDVITRALRREAEGDLSTAETEVSVTTEARGYPAGSEEGKGAKAAMNAALEAGKGREAVSLELPGNVDTLISAQ